VINSALYQLVWQRFVASQMTSAIYDTLSVDVTGRTPGHEIPAAVIGFNRTLPGILIVYEKLKTKIG